MAGPNTFGNRFSVTIIGESHGKCVGVVVDGLPAGLLVDMDAVNAEMARRRPGQSAITTRRAETDAVDVLSGLLDGKTTGAPVTMVAWNRDVDSSAYDIFKTVPRPGHADYPASIRFGGHADHRGSGRFSGRLTAGLVMAGTVAKQAIARVGLPVRIGAHVRSIETVILDGPVSLDDMREQVEQNPVRCYDQVVASKMVEAIQAAMGDDDSVGGTIECIIDGIPAGLGDPFFHSVESDLASTMFSIGAIKGIEFGSGFKGTTTRGSVNNDGYTFGPGGRVDVLSNNAGGILGGITTGAPVVFTVAVKPTASIGKPQPGVDLSTGKDTTLQAGGRHDPCIVPRAVPVIEAASWIVMLDLLMVAGRVPAVLA